MSWDAFFKERYAPEPKSGLTREQKPVRAAFLDLIAPEFADALVAEGAELVERDGKRFVRVEFEFYVVESRIAEPGELEAPK